MHLAHADCRARIARLLALHAAMMAVLLFFEPASELHAGNVELTSIETTVSDLERTRSFYTDVLQFRAVSESRASECSTATLQLGEETLVLVDPKADGRPIPLDMPSNDRLFQHIAIVVSDIDAAYRRLVSRRVAIVSDGPQTLPGWNFDAAGIRALYFRDPDGHFLELIEFPPAKGEPKWRRRDGQLFLGIDHTAIVVRDMQASLHFYRDVLGLTITGSSLNYGAEQESLNGVPTSKVEITGLRGAKAPGSSCNTCSRAPPTPLPATPLTTTCCIGRSICGRAASPRRVSCHLAARSCSASAAQPQSATDISFAEAYRTGRGKAEDVSTPFD